MATHDVRIARPPEPKWEWTVTPDWSVYFCVPAAPGWFVRLMQRALLGIRWRRIRAASTGGEGGDRG